MTKYRNINNNSGVDTYQISEISISVIFKGNPKIYVFSHSVAGREHVEKMKQLALGGMGLNSYIKKNVNDKYDRR